MRSVVEVWGKASQTKVGEFPITDPTENLLFFLMRHNVPVASSCAGDGVCKKCALSSGELACKLVVGELEGPIWFDYL